MEDAAEERVAEMLNGSHETPTERIMKLRLLSLVKGVSEAEAKDGTER